MPGLSKSIHTDSSKVTASLTWVSSPSPPLPPGSEPPHPLLTPSSVLQAAHFTNRTPAPTLPTLLLSHHLPPPPLYCGSERTSKLGHPSISALDVLSPTQAPCSIRYPSPSSAFLCSLRYLQPTKEKSNPTSKVKQKNLLFIFHLSLLPTNFLSSTMVLRARFSLFPPITFDLLISSHCSTTGSLFSSCPVLPPNHGDSLGMKIRYRHSPA